MYLLDEMLPYYVEVLNRYIKNRGDNFLLNIFFPHEAMLRSKKRALANNLLERIRRLTRDDGSNTQQEIRADQALSIDSSAPVRKNSGIYSELQSQTPLTIASNNTSKYEEYFPLSGSTPGASTLSAYRHQNDKTRHRNCTDSESGGMEEQMLSEDAINSDNRVLPAYIDRLKNAVENQIQESEAIRAQHQPGVYDALLEAIADNLVCVRFRENQADIICQENNYLAQDDLKIFSITFRDTLYKIINEFICMMRFDSSLKSNPTINLAAKKTYNLGTGVIECNDQALIETVRTTLHEIAYNIFAKDFAEVSQYLKTLSDYGLVQEQLTKIGCSCYELISRINELRSELEQKFFSKYPYMSSRGNIEEQVKKFRIANSQFNIIRFSLSSSKVAPTPSPSPSSEEENASVSSTKSSISK